MNKKTLTRIDELLARYKKADKEYLESMYDLEEYVKLEIGGGDDNCFTEVIDNCLVIQLKHDTSEFHEFKEILDKGEVSYEYEEGREQYSIFFKFDLWNISTLMEYTN